jgi:hypothetical protein
MVSGLKEVVNAAEITHRDRRWVDLPLADEHVGAAADHAAEAAS